MNFFNRVVLLSVLFFGVLFLDALASGSKVFAKTQETHAVYMWKERHVSRGYTRGQLKEIQLEKSKECRVTYSPQPLFYFSGIVDKYFGKQPYETLLTKSRGRTKYGRRQLASGSLISFSAEEYKKLGKAKYLPFQIEAKNNLDAGGNLILMPVKAEIARRASSSTDESKELKKPFAKNKKCYGGYCQTTFIWGTSIRHPEDSVFQIAELYEGVEKVEKLLRFEGDYFRIHYSSKEKGFKQLNCCTGESCKQYAVFDVYRSLDPQGLKKKKAEMALAPGHIMAINNISYQCLSGDCKIEKNISELQDELKSSLVSDLERQYEWYSLSDQAIKMMKHSVLYAGERRPRGDCLNYVKEGLLGGGYINYHIGWNLKKDAALCSAKICPYRTLLSASHFGPWMKVMNFEDILQKPELKKQVRSPYDVPYGCVTIYKGHFHERCKGKGKKKRCWKVGSDRNAKHGHIETRHYPVWYENLNSVWATDRVKTQSFCRDKVKSGSDSCCEAPRQIKSKSCRYKKIKVGKGKKRRTKKVKKCSTHFIYKRRCFTDGFVSDFKRPYARHDWRSKCYKNRFPKTQNSSTCYDYTVENSETKYYSGDNRTLIEVYCPKK